MTVEQPINKFMYHPEHGPKLIKAIDDAVYQQHLDAGYYDSPADFPQESAEVAPEVAPAAQAAETEVAPEVVPEPDDGSTDLLDRFEADPVSLTKDEHVALGKSLGLHLMKSWKEETLIAKIQAHIQGE